MSLFDKEGKKMAAKVLAVIIGSSVAFVLIVWLFMTSYV